MSFGTGFLLILLFVFVFSAIKNQLKVPLRILHAWRRLHCFCLWCDWRETELLSFLAHAIVLLPGNEECKEIRQTPLFFK